MTLRFSPRFWAGLCFIASGTASVSFQTLWVHAGISRFGIILPVISVILSVFMLGLMIGTFAGTQLVRRVAWSAVLPLYIGVEIGIALLALAVPRFFDFGYATLLDAAALDSSAFLYRSSVIIALSLLPVCVLIGMTFPLMMRALELLRSEGTNFSFLYFANLIGAIAGCLWPLLAIELYGGHVTLVLTGLFNALAAAGAGALLFTASGTEPASATQPKHAGAGQGGLTGRVKLFLFMTGFVALGSEPIWVKTFTGVIGTSVYSFACVIGVYLAANVMGNRHYLEGRRSIPVIALPFAALLPIAIGSSAGLDLFGPLALMSIMPVCFLFGYFTPQIIDAVSRDRPDLAMRAYLWNFGGCVLGPLVTGYWLFPVFGLKISYLFLAALLALACLAYLSPVVRWPKALAYSCLFFGVGLIGYFVKNEEDYYAYAGRLYRDPLGHVAAMGEGNRKYLLVNGVGMTSLTALTKAMVHLPQAYLGHRTSEDALIICLGMGTTLRSALAAGFSTVTVVELNPAVIRAVPYFHDDLAEILKMPQVKIVADDGRRFISFNTKRYDLITIDPPPPISASGSGLLYSADFMKHVAARLKDDGVLSHWIPTEEPQLVGHVLAAIRSQFRYVKLFTNESLLPVGVHFIASNRPLRDMTDAERAATLSPRAAKDLMEFNWEYPADLPAAEFFKGWREVPLEKYWPQGAAIEPLSDDRRFNEFFMFTKRTK